MCLVSSLMATESHLYLWFQVPQSFEELPKDPSFQTQPGSLFSISAVEGLTYKCDFPGKGSITFKACGFRGSVHTELVSHGMRTVRGFLAAAAAAAALNKLAPHSLGGIETTQFHSVLLCCQLAFSIPLSPQKPQHDPLHGCCTIGAFILALAPAVLSSPCHGAEKVLTDECSIWDSTPGSR